MRLSDLAKLIRSKNAGPFMLTIDMLFPDETAMIRASRLVDRERIARLYGVPPCSVSLFTLAETFAIKISFPRPVPSGGEGDSDIYGCQYMAPLAAMEIEQAGDSATDGGQVT